MVCSDARLHRPRSRSMAATAPAVSGGGIRGFTCGPIEFLVDIVTQHHGVVVLGVVRAVQQDDVTFACGSHDRCPSLRMLIELLPVTVLELRPFGHLVLEPAA